MGDDYKDAIQLTDEGFISAYGSGYVLSTTGMGLTQQGEIIGETISRPESRTHKTARVLGLHTFFDDIRLIYNIVHQRETQIDKQATQIGPAIPLVPRYRNYYHWTIECLPRIRAVQEFNEQHNINITLVVPSDLPEWIAESLRLVDYDRNLIHPANSPVYHTSNLIVSSYPRPTTSECQWVRNRVLKNASKEDLNIKTGSNVYISRKNAMERRVLNEPEVMETLSRYNFKSYCLENLSVAEQAKLFNDADLVVGAHGAGLSNLIYCDDSVIIELFGEKVKTNYSTLAEANEIMYESLECDPTGVDLIVDVTRLEQIIGKLT